MLARHGFFIVLGLILIPFLKIYINMHNVKGFPPAALETIKMLASFTGSSAVLTREKEDDLSFIYASPRADDIQDKDRELFHAVLEKTALDTKEARRWHDFAVDKLAAPFTQGMECSFFFRETRVYSRLCLFRDSTSNWTDHQLILMKQTARIVEDQLSERISEPFSNPSDYYKNGFNLLFDIVPVGVFFYNQDLIISSFNTRFLSFAGIQNSELLNFDLKTIQDQTLIKAFRAPLSGEEGHFEGNFQLRDQVIRIRLKTAPVYNSTGQIIDMVAVVKDNTEHVNALKDLEESKNRLWALINGTPDIICFKDAQGRWMEANDAIKALFRLEGKDFLFKSEDRLVELVPELSEVFEQCGKSDKEAWNTKKPVVVEEVVPMLNGEERILDVIKTPVFDEEGEAKGIVILGRDITVRKKTEEMLRESEKRFRIVAIHANDIIFEWDTKTDQMEWFGKASSIGTANLPPSTFPEFAKLIYPEDRERIVHFWNNMFHDKKEWKDEFRVLTPKGDLKYYRGSGIMMFNSDPHTSKVIGTFTEVTQEKMLINSLREAVDEAQYNQARITGLLSVIPDMIFVFDRQGVIKDYHADNSHSLYLPPEAFMDRMIDEVLPSDIAVLTHETIATVKLNRVIEVYEYQLEVDDEQRIFESRMVFVDDNRYLSIVRDVTYARKVEQELVEAKEQAEKSDRLKSAFLANMSHEIRTPMNGILGFSELLRSCDLSKEEMDSAINVIVKSGQQLLAIINDVLEISQLETGQIKVISDRVNLNRLMMDLARFFELEAIEKSVELSYKVPEQEVFAIVDGGKVTQIFNNLLSNAFKFTQPGGHIRFGFEVEENFIRFFIHDDGVGIASQHHNIIFERFGQVLKVGATNKGGTGLGLSICKSLVELLGGEIWIESEIGHGASFYFSVPGR
jgi:PAS domain S-box-containing protein